VDGGRFDTRPAVAPWLRAAGARLLVVVLVLGVLAMHSTDHVGVAAAPAVPAAAAVAAVPVSSPGQPGGCDCATCDDASAVCVAVVGVNHFQAPGVTVIGARWSENDREPATWCVAPGGSRPARRPVGLAIAGLAVARI